MTPSDDKKIKEGAGNAKRGIYIATGRGREPAVEFAYLHEGEFLVDYREGFATICRR